MPKASQARTNARKEEIISACAALYETMSFKDITLKDISQATSFTRTSIYNYFQTKEEIFLALLQREYDLWHQDLLVLLDTHEAMTADAFSEDIQKCLECGMNAHVSKPIDIRELLRLLQKYLG